MSIFSVVLNMIRIALNFCTHKKTLKRNIFSVSGRLRPRALCHPSQDNYSVSQSKSSVKCFFYLDYLKNSFNFFSTLDRDKSNGFLLMNSHRVL